MIYSSSSYAQQRSMTPARGYFNQSAYQYSDKKTDEALETVNKGLASFPNDMELIKLKELLEKKQDQKNNGKDQKKDKKGEEEDKKDEKKPNEQERDKTNEENGEKRPQKAEEMTPEEAKMLLDAMRNDEEAQRDAMRRIKGAPEAPQNGKDW